MPCPMGFRAEEGVENPHTATANGNSSKAKADKSKDIGMKTGNEGKSDAERFNYEKDPVSWFYQHQIKSEEESKAKQIRKKVEHKERLIAIMAKKKKVLQFEYDDRYSIASSELSELDSDVGSLSSLVSCAKSWIEDASYNTPAELSLKCALPGSMVVCAFTLFQSYTAHSAAVSADVKVVHGNSLYFAAAVAGLVLLTSLVAHLSVKYRSKRLLLGSLFGMACAYAAAVAITAILSFSPTHLEGYQAGNTCTKQRHSGPRQCTSDNGPGRELNEAVRVLQWGCTALAASAIILAALCTWYVFEVTFIEKKALKHKRRHEKRKHSIPWNKIKITGPVTNCSSMAAKGVPPSGNCPMGMGAAAGGGGGCPMGMGAAK